MSVTTVRRALLAAVCVACVAPAGASASSRLDRTEARIVRAMNEVRASHGLAELRVSAALARAADAHSKAMSRTKRFGHGDFARRVRRYVRARRMAENIALRRPCNARAIVSMWLNSAPHRAVMLSSAYRRVGVARRGSPVCYVTADFASAR